MRVNPNAVVARWPHNDEMYALDFAEAVSRDTSHGFWAIINSRVMLLRVALESSFRVITHLVLGFFSLIGMCCFHRGSRNFFWHTLKMLTIDTVIAVVAAFGVIRPSFGISVRNGLVSHLTHATTHRDGHHRRGLMSHYIRHQPIQRALHSAPTEAASEGVVTSQQEHAGPSTPERASTPAGPSIPDGREMTDSPASAGARQAPTDGEIASSEERPSSRRSDSATPTVGRQTPNRERYRSHPHGSGDKKKKHKKGASSGGMLESLFGSRKKETPRKGTPRKGTPRKKNR